MSISKLEGKFNELLKKINGVSTTKFSSTVESAYEALVLADVMNEYVKIEGGVKTITPPLAGSFLNQGPGKFVINKSYLIDFKNGKSFYFAADVEIFGLGAMNQNKPIGILFEADVVVIPEHAAVEVISKFNGYPAPQHLHSLYECKYGKYGKGQLRELLGLRRHTSFLSGNSNAHASVKVKGHLYDFEVLNANPRIAIKMVRPKKLPFLDIDTASLYDLHQLTIN